MDRGRIESVIRDNGYEDFKWVSGKDIVVSQKDTGVRLVDTTVIHSEKAAQLAISPS